jgi:hypothetical protein
MHPIDTVFFFFWGAWGIEFLLFPMSSHQVLPVFPSSFQWIPTHVPIAHHFVPHVLPNVVLLNLYNWENIGTCVSLLGVICFSRGESPKFQNFFVMGQ